MRRLAWLLAALLLLPALLSIVLSFSGSRYFAFSGAGWSLRWYGEFFSNPVWPEALGRSLSIAALASLSATAAALAASAARVRSRWIEMAMLLPLSLPAVALALGLLALFRATPLWGTLAGMVLAHTMAALPVAYLVLRTALDQIDPHLAAAARGLGATPWQAFRHITLPLAGPGLFVAATFSFLVSLNEIPLSLFLGTRETQTLPRLVFSQLRFSLTPLAAAASCLLFLLSAPLVAVAARLFRFTIYPWIRSPGGSSPEPPRS